MTNTSLKKINSSLKFVYSKNNSLSVIFHDNDLLMGVVGEFNKNLKELEKITNSNLYSRGNSIMIKSTILIIILTNTFHNLYFGKMTIFPLDFHKFMILPLCSQIDFYRISSLPKPSRILFILGAAHNSHYYYYL